MPLNLTYSDHAISLDGFPIYDAAVLLRELVRQGRPIDKVLDKANSFVLPRGLPFGRGWVLTTKNFVDQILAYTSANQFVHSLSFSDSYGTVVVQKLAIARCEAITGGNTANWPEAMYLIQLVDSRAVAAYSAINKSYNVRTYQYLTKTDAPDYFTHSLNGGSAWTWQQLIQDLWNALPGVMGGVTINGSFPTGSPENYLFQGVSAWHALNAVLADISHTVYRDLAGSWFIAPVAPNQGIQATEEGWKTLGFVRDATWDLPTRDFQVDLPAKVTVYFHAAYHAFHNVATDTNSRIVTGKDAWIYQPLYSEEYQTTDLFPAASPPTGTNVAIHDSLCAYYDESGALLNGVTLQARAVDVAESYLMAKSYRSDNSLHTVYLGYHPQIIPGPEVSAVWWFDLGRGSRTEVLLSPLQYNENDSPLKLGELRAQELLSCESNTAPDLRNHIPNDRWCMVKIYGGDIDPEGVGEAKVLYGTHSGGGVITWTESTKLIDVHNPWGVKIKEGTRLQADWHLQTRRWILRHPRKGTLFKGTLTANMCPNYPGIPVDYKLLDVESCEEVDVSEVLNSLKLAGMETDKFVAYYDCNANDGDGGYEMLNIQHHEEEYVRADFEDVPGCTPELDEYGEPTGRTVPTGICKVKYSKRKINVQWCRDPIIDLTLINATPENILVDWWIDGLNFKGKFVPGYLLCACDYYEEILATGTSCETGSGGSGSGG